MLLQIVVAYLYGRLRRAHLEVALPLSADGHTFQYNGCVVGCHVCMTSDCARHQRRSQHGCCHEYTSIFLC